MRRGRSGKFSGKLQLEGGWKLTAVNEGFNAQTAESLNAVSGRIGAVLKGAGVTSFAPPPTQGPLLFLFEVDLQKRILRPVDTTALDRLLWTVGPAAPGGSTP